MKKRLFIIVTAFCVSFILMVGLSLFSMERFTTFAAYSNQVDHTNTVIELILKTELYIRDIDRTERGYMITRDTMYIRFLRNSIDSINASIEDLKSITQDNPNQLKNIQLLKGALAVRIAAVNQNVIYVDTAQTSVPSPYYFDSRKQMQECSHQLNAMLAIEKDLLAKRFRYEQFYQQLTSETLKYLLIVFCIITLILFSIMIRELRGRFLFQAELQAKIIDLNRSHSELQEIAYAASHDLQEPLRKIQVFSNMLLLKNNPLESADNKNVLLRINNSANQMQLLINDLVNITSLTKTSEFKTKTDLNLLLKLILEDLGDEIINKGAKIELGILPEITGFDTQLRILFKALLDNSLKFIRDDLQPTIIISSQIINGKELKEINPNMASIKFYCITFEDNGIGFENQYINKIFGIFQRLHNQHSEFNGKGIGLAICQRIMANHEGYIMATGEPQKGAKFKLFFPFKA